MKRRLCMIVVLLFATVFVNTQGENLEGELDLVAITSDNLDELVLLIDFDLPDVLAFHWSADSTELLVGTYEGVWLLDISDMELRHVELDDTAGYNVAFVHDTHQIVVNNGSELILYDLDTSAIARIIPDSGNPRGISDDGTLYALVEVESAPEHDAVVSQHIRIYDVQQVSLLHEIEVSLYEGLCYYACPLSSVAFSPGNAQIAFAAQVPEVEAGLVDLATGDKQSLPMFGYCCIDYSPDGSLIAATVGRPGYLADSFLLVDTQTADILTQIDFYSSSSPDFTSSGELVAIGAYDDDAPNPDEAHGFLYYFDIQQLLSSSQFHPIRALSFARPPGVVEFSPDDRILAVSDGTGKLSLWGIRSKE